jgi:hypothetical protein
MQSIAVIAKELGVIWTRKRKQWMLWLCSPLLVSRAHRLQYPLIFTEATTTAGTSCCGKPCVGVLLFVAIWGSKCNERLSIYRSKCLSCACLRTYPLLALMFINSSWKSCVINLISQQVPVWLVRIKWFLYTCNYTYFILWGYFENCKTFYLDFIKL